MDMFDSLVITVQYSSILQLQFDHEISYPCAFSILVTGNITGPNINGKNSVPQRNLVSQRLPNHDIELFDAFATQLTSSARTIGSTRFRLRRTKQ